MAKKVQVPLFCFFFSLQSVDVSSHLPILSCSSLVESDRVDVCGVKTNKKKRKVSDVFFFKYKIFCPLEFVRELIDKIFTDWAWKLSFLRRICVGFSRATLPTLSVNLFMNITTRNTEMITHKWKNSCGSV